MGSLVLIVVALCVFTLGYRFYGLFIAHNPAGSGAGIENPAGIILCTAENFKIDEQDCGLDFFDPTDRRYEYRRKKERKNTTAKH